MTEQRAQALATMDDAKKVREFYAQKRPFSAFLGNMAGQALDPINYVPIAGPLVRAAAIGRFGKIAGEALVASVDAAANTGLFAFATAGERAKFGDDVSWQSTVSQIATAALIGGAFGAISGAIGKRVDARRMSEAESRLATLRTTQESRIALNEGIDALVRGEDIRLSPNSTDPMARVAGDLAKMDMPVKAQEFTQTIPPAEADAAQTSVGRDVKQIETGGAGTTTPQDNSTANAFSLRRGDHGEMALPEPKAGVDDRVYAIEQNGQPVAYANIRVAGDTADVRDLYSITDTRHGLLGTSAVRKVLREFLKENPEVKTLTGERVTGARFGGADHGFFGEGVPFKMDVTAARPEPMPEGIKQAEATIAKPDDAKALASQYRVDPQTGGFHEEAEVAQLALEGRLTEHDVATMAQAQADYETGAAYAEALKSVAACLL
jgi:hypothetical protein